MFSRGIFHMDKIIKYLVKAANILDLNGFKDMANEADALVEQLSKSAERTVTPGSMMDRIIKNENPSNIDSKESDFQKKRVTNLVSNTIVPNFKSGIDNLTQVLKLLNSPRNEASEGELLKHIGLLSRLFSTIDLAKSDEFEIYPEYDYNVFIVPAYTAVLDIRNAILSEDSFHPQSKKDIENAIESLKMETKSIEQKYSMWGNSETPMMLDELKEVETYLDKDELKF